MRHSLMIVLRRNMWVIWVLALIFIVGAFACSATPQKRSIGEVIDDSVISNKLKVKFLKDKKVKAFKINIDTWKGVVNLRGKVETQEQIERAIEIAERQPGVKEVKSYLVLKDPLKKAEGSSKPVVKKETSAGPEEEEEEEVLEESEIDAPPDDVITD